MGRQPFGLASPAAWLRADGWDVACVDVAKQKLEDAAIADADLVGFHLPMHTATRLAAPVIRKVRAVNGTARVCAFGLYAPLNDAWLRSLGVEAIFGGEFEEELARWAAGPKDPPSVRRPGPSGPGVPRIHFLVPDRSTLPP